MTGMGGQYDRNGGSVSPEYPVPTGNEVQQICTGLTSGEGRNDNGL
jgi:hypothetical protein